MGLTICSILMLVCLGLILLLGMCHHHSLFIKHPCLVGTKCFKMKAGHLFFFSCICHSGLLFRSVNCCSFVALLTLPGVKTWHGQTDCTKMGGSQPLCRHPPSYVMHTCCYFVSLWPGPNYVELGPKWCGIRKRRKKIAEIETSVLGYVTNCRLSLNTFRLPRLAPDCLMTISF